MFNSLFSSKDRLRNLLLVLAFVYFIVQSVSLISEKSFLGDTYITSGTYVLTKDNIEYVYQVPDSVGSNPDHIEGVLFLAHGCSHSATDFWPQSPKCSKCIGLPIERTIVVQALSRSYVVVAMSSTDRDTKCWHAQEDAVKAKRVLLELRAKVRIPNYVPNFLHGVSSGGQFVGSLAMYLNQEHTMGSGNNEALEVKAICIQIHVFPQKYWNTLAGLDNLPQNNNYLNNNNDVDNKRRDAFPKGIMYVHMERDPRLTAMIERSMAVLTKTAPQLTIINKLVEAEPLTEDYFFKHGRHLTYQESSLLVNAFKSSALLDDQGYLVGNPRSSAVPWRQVVLKALPSIKRKDSLINDGSGISELLNAAYAQHEITDAYLSDTLNFFDSYGVQGRKGQKVAESDLDYKLIAKEKQED